MIDITLHNFQEELVESSQTVPVLLDIWAPWCGPCKTLGPILESLEVAYQGRFRLAKLNADEVPQLAGQLSQMLGVRSIPFCVMFKDGQPVDGFVGAIAESEIRAFLDKHVEPASQDGPLDASTAEGADPAPADEPAEALNRLAQASAAAPGDENLLAQWVHALLQAGQADQAAQALAATLRSPVVGQRIRALDHWTQAVLAQSRFAGTEACEQAIALNRRDFASRYALAQHHLAQRKDTDALDALLEILMRDKAWEDGLARKTYVSILELMTPAAAPKVDRPAPVPGSPEHKGKLEIAGRVEVPVSDPVLESYRRKLSMALF